MQLNVEEYNIILNIKQPEFNIFTLTSEEHKKEHQMIFYRKENEEYLNEIRVYYLKSSNNLFPIFYPAMEFNDLYNAYESISKETGIVRKIEEAFISKMNEFYHPDNFLKTKIWENVLRRKEKIESGESAFDSNSESNAECSQNKWCDSYHKSLPQYYKPVDNSYGSNSKGGKKKSLIKRK